MENNYKSAHALPRLYFEYYMFVCFSTLSRLILRSSSKNRSFSIGNHKCTLSLNVHTPVVSTRPVEQCYVVNISLIVS